MFDTQAIDVTAGCDISRAHQALLRLFHFQGVSSKIV